MHRSTLSPAPFSGWMPRLVRGGSLIALLALAWCAAAQNQNAAPPPAIDLIEERSLAPEQGTLDEVNLDRITLPQGTERRRQSQLREALTPVTPPESQFRIKALEGTFDYDPADEIFYSPGRTQIRYGRFYLEGDKVVLDARQQEVQAEGNVVLKIDGDTIYADSIRYNYQYGEGVGYNVSGSHEPLYFRSAAKPDEKGEDVPQFQKVSKQEALFRNTQITTCDFKVPHYFVRGREVILYLNDRIFFRGATVYVWGVPSFYLPMYTRSLTEPSPWFMNLGYNSRTGARIRLGYHYVQQVDEPSLEDEEVFENRSSSTADVFFDYLSKRGQGAGVDYQYQFDFGRHKGEFMAYGLKDSDRDVVGLSPAEGDTLFSDSDRWRLEWLHRTQITKDLYIIANIDEFSDPDIFYDVLDRFTDRLEDRERQVVRRGRIAASFVKDAYTVRILADIKDRIGLDRYTDFSDPVDDNRDLELDPYNKLDDSDANGISSDRWGRVSRKMPHITAASRWLPIGRRGLYYDAKLDIYNALDKGLNTVDDEDDANVRGAELYQAIMKQWKLSERYVLTSKFGVGVGVADRDDNIDVTFNPSTDALGFPRVADTSYPSDIDGVTWVDEDTFLVGRRERSFNQINPGYAWADTEQRLTARFSDALTGDVGWRYRETTDDFIGDWYASLGSTTFREDLYNYKIREHWVDGGLSYRLSRPMLTLFTRASYNLESRSDVYSKEPLAMWGNGFTWANQRQTVAMRGYTGFWREQLYDPSDPRAFEQDNFYASLKTDYQPVHGRWYTSIRARQRNVSGGQTEPESYKDYTYFTEDEDKTDVRWTYGRRIGPKWNTEFMARWDTQVGGLRELSWLLQRDLHDAIGTFQVRVRNKAEHANDREDNSNNEMDLRFGLRFKLPQRKAAFGASGIRTLQQKAREPEMAY